jgi:hypothetical protein
MLLLRVEVLGSSPADRGQSTPAGETTPNTMAEAELSGHHSEPYVTATSCVYCLCRYWRHGPCTTTPRSPRGATPATAPGSGSRREVSKGIGDR